MSESGENESGESGESDEQSDSALIDERRAKLERLRAAGHDPFPHSFPGRTTIAAVREANQDLADGEETEFATTGSPGGSSPAAAWARRPSSTCSTAAARSSCSPALTSLGAESHELLVGMDLGDHIGVDGMAFKSRRGELTLRVDSWVPLAKSLRPLPDKYHGLEDVETRYRHRELDLIANPEVKRDASCSGRGRSPRSALARRTRLHRGRDAGAAADLRRRTGAAVHHPSQRPRPRPLPADRHRALPQALHRRRHRSRLRARQGLPQRGHLAQAQPRVHDARVVRGVRRLRGQRRAARAAGRAGRRAGPWRDPDRARRSRDRSDAALAPRDADRRAARAHRHRPRRPARVASSSPRRSAPPTEADQGWASSSTASSRSGSSRS